MIKLKDQPQVTTTTSAQPTTLGLVEMLQLTNEDFTPDDLMSKATGAVAKTPDRSQFRHLFAMRHLKSVYDREELDQFISQFASLRRTFSSEDVDQYYCSEKLDGISADLLYRNGQLRLALDKGDGVIGNDITQVVFTIPNVPKFISTKTVVCVRGEIVVHKADFTAVNNRREAKHLPRFTEVKTYLQDSLKLTPKAAAERKLKFYAWEVKVLAHPELSQEQQMKQAVKWNFTISKGELCTSIEDILAFVNNVSANRYNLAYSIDGIVIKQNTAVYQKALGFAHDTPLFACAWKFAKDGLATNVNTIDWQMNRTGALTPILNLEPIVVNGDFIDKVPLSDAGDLKQRSLGTHAKIQVDKTGGSIAKITKVLDSGQPLEIPEVCPYCGQPLTWKDTVLYCTNPNCKEVLYATLAFILGPEVLKLHVDENFIRVLINSKTVTNVLDIFTPLESKVPELTQDELDKLVIRARSMNFLEFILMLDVPGMGRAVAAKLAMETCSISNLIRILKDPNEMKYLSINDGVKQNLIDWYKVPTHQQFLAAALNLQLPYCGTN